MKEARRQAAIRASDRHTLATKGNHTSASGRAPTMCGTDVDAPYSTGFQGRSTAHSPMTFYKTKVTLRKSLSRLNTTFPPQPPICTPESSYISN